MKAAQVSQHPRVAAKNCLTSHTVRKALVYDNADDGCCYLRTRGETSTDFDFALHNAKGQTFHFVQVDKCMFSDKKDGERCDCLLFTESVCLFVEFKSSKSVSGKQNVRHKAFSQLCASVEWFLTENLLAAGEVVEVVLANGPRKRSPRFTTNNIEKTAELQELFPSLRIRYDELPFYKL